MVHNIENANKNRSNGKGPQKRSDIRVHGIAKSKEGNPNEATLRLRLLWRARYQRLSVFKELGIIFQNRNMYLSGCQ